MGARFVKASFAGILLVVIMAQLILAAGFILWRQGDVAPQRKQEVANLLLQRVVLEQQQLQQHLLNIDVQQAYLTTSWPGLMALAELDANGAVTQQSPDWNAELSTAVKQWWQLASKPAAVKLKQQVLLIQARTLPGDKQLIALQRLAQSNLGLAANGPWRLQFLAPDSKTPHAVVLAFDAAHWALTVQRDNNKPLLALLLLVLCFAIAISYTYSHILQRSVLTILRELGQLILEPKQLEQFNNIGSLQTRLQQTLRNQKQQ